MWFAILEGVHMSPMLCCAGEQWSVGVRAQFPSRLVGLTVNSFSHSLTHPWSFRTQFVSLYRCRLLHVAMPRIPRLYNLNHVTQLGSPIQPRLPLASLLDTSFCTPCSVYGKCYHPQEHKPDSEPGTAAKIPWISLVWDQYLSNCISSCPRYHHPHR